jgi:hypothetical protein
VGAVGECQAHDGRGAAARARAGAGDPKGGNPASVRGILSMRSAVSILRCLTSGLLVLWASSTCNSLTGVNDLVVSQGQSAAGDGSMTEGDAGVATGSGGDAGSNASGGAEGSGDLAGAGRGGSTANGGSGSLTDPVQGCDLVTGSGCSKAETCAFDDVALDSVCRPLASNPVQPYAECATDTECPALHSCFGGVCNEHCNLPSDCGWAGALCIEIAPDEGWNLCTRNCDPVSTAAPRAGLSPCGAGARCLIIGSFEYTDCVGTGGVLGAVDGSPCQEDLDCLAGSICIDFGGVTRCQRACDVGGAACLGSNVCRSVGTVTGVEVGFCESPLCDPVAPTRDDAVFSPCVAADYCLPGINGVVASCVPAAGAAGADQPCAGHFNCASGLACFEGACRAWCRPGGSCSGSVPGATCSFSLIDVATSQPLAFQGASADPIGICGLCNDTCEDADDSFCDDGGPNFDYDICPLGSDCTDCGPR